MLHIIIDGYNLIHASRGTDDDWTQLSLEKARNALVGFLLSKRKERRERITVVFDGSSGMYPRESSPHGVEVLFSEAGVTADTVICHMVESAPNPRTILVVSDDRQIKASALKAGAKPLASRTFLRESHKAAEKRRRAGPPEPREKFDGTKPGDVQRWRKVLGLDEGEAK
jgi:predicted RNA-binding protein with PIN domain